MPDAETQLIRSGLRCVHGVLWLVITDQDADVCDADPGYPIAVTVTGSLRRMTEVWRGDVGWPDALRSGALTIMVRSRSAAPCPGGSPCRISPR